MLSLELTLRQSKKVLFTLTGTRTSYIILITVALICINLEALAYVTTVTSKAF